MAGSPPDPTLFIFYQMVSNISTVANVATVIARTYLAYDSTKDP